METIALRTHRAKASLERRIAMPRRLINDYVASTLLRQRSLAISPRVFLGIRINTLQTIQPICDVASTAWAVTQQSVPHRIGTLALRTSSCHWATSALTSLSNCFRSLQDGM